MDKLKLLTNRQALLRYYPDILKCKGSIKSLEKYLAIWGFKICMFTLYPNKGGSIYDDNPKTYYDSGDLYDSGDNLLTGRFILQIRRYPGKPGGTPSEEEVEGIREFINKHLVPIVAKCEIISYKTESQTCTTTMTTTEEIPITTEAPLPEPDVKTKAGYPVIGGINFVGGYGIERYRDVESYGVEYRKLGETQDIVIIDFTEPLATSSFETHLKNLEDGETYEYRAYIKIAGVTYFGNFVKTTIISSPSVDTREGVGIIGGIEDLGGINIFRFSDVGAYGIKYRHFKDSENNNWVKKELGYTLTNDNFKTTLTGLRNNVTYEYKAYIEAENQTYEGDVKGTLTKKPIVYPSVQTSVGIAQIGKIRQVGGYNMRNYTGLEEVGVEYKLDTDSTYIEHPMSVPSQTNFFKEDIDGLSQGTKYNYRAYIKVGGNIYRGETRNIVTLSEAQTTNIPFKLGWLHQEGCTGPYLPLDREYQILGEVELISIAHPTLVALKTVNIDVSEIGTHDIVFNNVPSGDYKIDFGSLTIYSKFTGGSVVICRYQWVDTDDITHNNEHITGITTGDKEFVGQVIIA